MTADGGLITGAGKAHDSGRGAMTADGKLITGAGKAYDSGRGGSFCAFLFVFSLLFWLFLGSFLALDAGPPCCSFFGRASCVRFCLLFVRL